MTKRWLAAALTCIFLLTGCGGKEEPPTAPTPVPAAPPVQESPAESAPEKGPPAAPLQNEADESPAFCGTWYTRMTDGDGQNRLLKLTLQSDGCAEYCYGIPESDILESFDGAWREADGLLTLELHGGPVSEDGSDLPEFAYDSLSAFQWDCQDRQLYLQHTAGDALLYGTEDAFFAFLPFDAHRFAGIWSAEALYRDWVYDLSLLENGDCLLRLLEYGEELACYEGLWSIDSDGYVNLDMNLCSGRHPENPEMEWISGTYLAEKNGSVLELSFVSGDILTLNMEEDGYETFTLASAGSCVSIHTPEELSADLSDCDWVIVDDTDPAVEAVFCTMVPVEDFTVVSLFLQDISEDGTELFFDVTELYTYGTLTPEMPLRVTLTIYGTIPSYGVSFTDPDGVHRLYGVTVSGFDGSLELTEI